MCVCGAQAWIEAQRIYIDEEDLFAHLSFYLLFDGVPQYVLSAESACACLVHFCMPQDRFRVCFRV